MKLDAPIAIVLHHAASSRYATYKDIANVGIQQHGIPDYHFIIDYQGNIHSVLSMTEVAAHCGIDKWDLYQDESGVTNQNSIAICAIGNFEQEIMPEAQLNAIVKCIRNIKIQYPKLFIKIHKELVNTACPGKNYPFKEILKRLDMGKTIILNTQGSERNIAIVDGVKKTMPLHLVSIKDRNMIDLRFIVEALGGTISWDENKKQITIKEI